MHGCCDINALMDHTTVYTVCLYVFMRVVCVCVHSACACVCVCVCVCVCACVYNSPHGIWHTQHPVAHLITTVVAQLPPVAARSPWYCTHCRSENIATLTYNGDGTVMSNLLDQLGIPVALKATIHHVLKVSFTDVVCHHIWLYMSFNIMK